LAESGFPSQRQSAGFASGIREAAKAVSLPRPALRAWGVRFDRFFRLTIKTVNGQHFEMTTDLEAKLRRALAKEIYPMEQVFFETCFHEIGGSAFEKPEGFMDIVLGFAAAGLGAGTSAIALTSKRFVRLKKSTIETVPVERTSVLWSEIEKIEIKKNPDYSPREVGLRIYLKNKKTVEVYVIRKGVNEALELFERMEEVLKMI
jgi:hypothetical protein